MALLIRVCNRWRIAGESGDSGRSSYWLFAAVELACAGVCGAILLVNVSSAEN